MTNFETHLRGGQTVPIQEGISLTPRWGVSCPYCGSRNNTELERHTCYACDGEFTWPTGALSVQQVTRAGRAMKLIQEARRRPR